MAHSFSLVFIKINRRQTLCESLLEPGKSPVKIGLATRQTARCLLDRM
jgi:hypothetical protein